MAEAVAAPPPARLRLQLRGAVQGVGMRPFVHRLATDCDLAGFVRNGPDGVLIEVEGVRVAEFAARLARETPRLARIDTISDEVLPPLGVAGFSIGASIGGAIATRVPADAATCPACLAELFDPASRFFAYPFVTCTQCGPRYTIADSLPFDRPRTAMRHFALCPACTADYADPTGRRFHAETIACPACGPRLSHDIAHVAAALRGGKIVALKGIGGFHLMCDARNQSAVAELRRRKARDAKPFAVMVANAASLHAVARPLPAEAALAACAARPIVLMAARPGVLAAGVSPGLARVGVMLAYAPPQHLVFAHLAGGKLAGHDPQAANDDVLVATSANLGGEPLVIDDADAAARLRGIADLIVTHNRPIATRADDSVVQVVAGAPAYVRRARGFVPEPVPLAADGPPVLALGAHLKNTVTVLRGREAFVSQHIGDLCSAETVRCWRETIRHLTRTLGVRPDCVAHDLHPDYLATRLAGEFGAPMLAVQHHAAHIAAVAAEHGIEGGVLGLALDGHGLGADGGNWGGELLRIDGASWQRLGHIAPLPLPGGDRAAREPWRMGVAALAAIGAADQAAARFPARPLAAALARRAQAGALPTTTSLGRLFDAAAALLGVRAEQFYEGQAAMELEALVTAPAPLPGGWRLDGRQLSFVPLLRALAGGGLTRVEGANLMHGTLAEGLAALAEAGARATGLTHICLGGGCLQNRVLAEDLCARLRARGMRPKLPRALPPNDGGLSLGQAVLARRMTIGY
jgi:hydrogenase maturation protein HypF